MEQLISQAFLSFGFFLEDVWKVEEEVVFISSTAL